MAEEEAGKDESGLNLHVYPLKGMKMCQTAPDLLNQGHGCVKRQRRADFFSS